MSFQLKNLFDQFLTMDPLKLCKILISFTVIFHMLNWLSYFDLLFAVDGIIGTDSLADNGMVGITKWLFSSLSDTQIFLLYILGLICIIKFTFSETSPLFGSIAYCIFLVFSLRNTYVNYGGLLLLRIFFIFCVLGDIMKYLHIQTCGSPEKTRKFILLLFQWQFILVYTMTVLAKSDGSGWIDGHAIINTLSSYNFAIWDFCFLHLNLFIAQSLTYMTIIIETLLVFLILLRAFNLATIVGILFHFTIGLLLNVHGFSLVMICGLLGLRCLANSTPIKYSN